MSSNTTDDVLIVGAGPVGLTLACELSRRGISYRLIEKRAERKVISKAAAIMARSLEVFDNIGVVDALLEAGIPISRLAVYSQEKQLVSMGFDDLDTPFPMILGLPQYETERILEEHLNSHGGSIERSHELLDFAQDDEAVIANVTGADGSTEVIRARYLVGCDGAHSPVRKQLRIPLEGSSFHENFIVAHVPIDWDMPHDQAFEFHSPNGTIAGGPLPENTWSIVFELDESQWNFDHPPAPPLGELQELFDQRSPFPGRLQEPRWSSYFRVNHRQVPAYRKGRVFLAGDAAHIHGPAGGQGMNTGIQDVHNLAWKLAQVCQGIAREEILDSYHAERHPIGQATVKFSTGLQTELNRRNRITMALRDCVTEMAGRAKYVQRLMGRQLGELSYHYRQSPIVSEFRSGVVYWYRHARYSDFMDCIDFGAAPRAGDRVLDAKLSTKPEHNDNSIVRMYDLIRETGHKLFLFEGTHGENTPEDEWPTLRRAAERVREKYGDRLKTFIVLPRFEAPRYVNYDGQIVLDGDGTLHYRYGARGPCLYVIRPDGYIGYRSDVVDGAGVEEHLAEILK